MPFTTPGKLWENGIFLATVLKSLGTSRQRSTDDLQEVLDKNGRPNDGR